MAEDLEERKKKEEKEKRERYEEYKSASRRAENKTVESWVEYITKKEALRRILFPPISYVQSGLQGGWNWLKENTVLGLFLEGTGSDYVSDGLYNAQSRMIVDDRLGKGREAYIENNTLITPEHKYAIEKNRLEALNEAIKKNPDNINLIKKAFELEKNHLDLMKEFTEVKYDERIKEFTSKSGADPTLKEQMKELEKSYEKHLEILEKADPDFARKIKNGHNEYKNEELDYKAFLPHFAGGIGIYPQDESKKLIKRLGSSRAMELINTIDTNFLPDDDFKRKLENIKKTGIHNIDETRLGMEAMAVVNSIDTASLSDGDFKTALEDLKQRYSSASKAEDKLKLEPEAIALIIRIDTSSLPDGDLKTKLENVQNTWRSGLNEFSDKEANVLLGLCDSKKYKSLTEDTFKDQIKGLGEKEQNMFLSNPHFGGFKTGGLEGFSTDAVTKYLGHSPYINDYKKVQYNPDFIKDAYSLKGFCSNKQGFVTNPSTVFLYGDPTNESKDLKNTINHEAAHSVLHALQKSDYMAKDVSKVEKAFEVDIKHKLNKSFSGFSLEEGAKVMGTRISSSKKEEELKMELEGIMGKGKTYPRLNKTMNHLKAMGIENPTPELITTLDDMVYGKGRLVNNEGRKVPNNLGNIEDADIRFMVAVSYFNPAADVDAKTQDQLKAVRGKINDFSKKNEEVIDAHLDVFVKPVVSSGYNKEQHNEEKLVRFIADEQNVMDLMKTKFSNDPSVTKEEKKVFDNGIESGRKVQNKYEELQKDTYNLCENPNPISAIWNKQIKSSHAHSHERKADGSVMNHADVIPAKPRTNIPESKETEPARVSKDVGKEPSYAEKLQNQKQDTVDNIRQI